MTSKDGFKLAAEIRRGERDSELPDYDVIVSWIHRCPKTWLGGILASVTARAACEPFFKDDAAMMAFIERAIWTAKNHPGSVLRKDALATKETPDANA